MLKFRELLLQLRRTNRGTVHARLGDAIGLLSRAKITIT